MKKVFLVIGVMIFAAGLLFSGGSGEQSSDLTEIRVMVYERGEQFSSGNSTVDNELTRWINEELAPQGVKVTYVAIPRSGADDTVNSMLAAGDAPDVVMTYDFQRVSTYASQGGLLDLTPYIDRLDPEWLDSASSGLEAVELDGKLYCLPRVYEHYGRSHHQYIRKDIVEALGMEMPSSKAELIDYLYAVKENYPDMIPFGFSGAITDSRFINFILAYTSHEDERENYIYEPSFTSIFKEGGKEGLRQLNQFVLDGIIDPNFAIDTDETKLEQDLANGKIGFVIGNDTDHMFPGYSNPDLQDYRMWPVNTLENADGDLIVPSSSAVSNYVYVPAASEDKIDAIMVYLNFMSNHDNCIEIENARVGIGSELGEDGIPIKKSNEEIRELGFPTSLGDFSMLVRFPIFFGKEPYLRNQQATYPEVPAEFFEADYDIRYNPEGYYDMKNIGSALPSDKYVPLLQTLICEFVLKVMNAPEGQFEEVYQEQYEILLDNHLQEVLDERTAWYDSVIATSN